MVLSPRNSFKGYNFSTALYRNKDAIKLTIGILGTYGTYLSVAGFDWKSFLIALGLGLLNLCYKLIQDAAEYFFKEVETVV